MEGRRHTLTKKNGHIKITSGFPDVGPSEQTVIARFYHDQSKGQLVLSFGFTAKDIRVGKAASKTEVYTDMTCKVKNRAISDTGFIEWFDQLAQEGKMDFVAERKRVRTGRDISEYVAC